MPPARLAEVVGMTGLDITAAGSDSVSPVPRDSHGTAGTVADCGSATPGHAADPAAEVLAATGERIRRQVDDALDRRRARHAAHDEINRRRAARHAARDAERLARLHGTRTTDTLTEQETK